MVHPPGEGTEVDPPGVTGTVVHPPAEGTEVDPPGVTGTVVHPLGDGTEVDPPVAGVAIRLTSAWRKMKTATKTTVEVLVRLPLLHHLF